MMWISIGSNSFGWEIIRDSGMKNLSVQSSIDKTGAFGIELGECLDTVNSLTRGEGAEDANNAFLPYTLYLHVNDFSMIRGGTDMRFTPVSTPAGQGKLNIPEQLARLKMRWAELRMECSADPRSPPSAF